MPKIEIDKTSQAAAGDFMYKMACLMLDQRIDSGMIATELRHAIGCLTTTDYLGKLYGEARIQFCEEKAERWAMNARETAKHYKGEQNEES